MRIFYRSITDPHFNIAAEEYYIKHAVEDMCMIWINNQSVIIGKHQNAYAEINYPYTRAHNIPVIRRISGGGAVYHDAGNVNFTFIKKTEKSNLVDFSRFTSVIIKFMQSIGVEVNVNKRNSLFVEDLKFSGHAEHVFHDKVLHHGTILFNTNLIALKHCLNPVGYYRGKAMASVHSEVGNIAPILPENIDIQEFIDRLVAWLKHYYSVSRTTGLLAEDLQAINQLSEEKYKTWEWNFGYSPAYSFHADIQVFEGQISLHIKVENGKFADIELPAEIFSDPLKQSLSGMKGLLHKEEEIETFLSKNRLVFELAGVNIVTFTGAFFR